MVMVGIPTELKVGGRRVALTPSGVSDVVSQGHRVVVEGGCGAGSGFSDADYRSAGAHVAGASDVWCCAVVVKVKEPILEEYDVLAPDTALFGFLHLAANAELEQLLVERRLTA